MSKDDNETTRCLATAIAAGCTEDEIKIDPVYGTRVGRWEKRRVRQVGSPHLNRRLALPAANMPAPANPPPLFHEAAEDPW